LLLPDEAETGSAEEQPARNNQSDWNDNGVGLTPASYKNHSGQLCLKKLIIIIFL
jgi:hypothetical protein